MTLDVGSLVPLDRIPHHVASLPKKSSDEALICLENIVRRRIWLGRDACFLLRQVPEGTVPNGAKFV